MPTVTATVARDGGAPVLRVAVGEPARAVRVWSATARSADFRDARWTSVPAAADGGAFRAALPAPHGRWVAGFAEAAFEGAGPTFVLSTPMEVLAPSP
jgi:hypothetical protein